MEKQRIRAAAIVVHQGAILLMHRKRNGREYYVIPGGGVELHESIQTAVLRELAEETSIKARVVRLVYVLNGSAQQCNAQEQFYLCEYISGEPMLAADSVERERMRMGEQWYEPLWIPISMLASINLLPPVVKDWLVTDFKEGFWGQPRSATVSKE